MKTKYILATLFLTLFNVNSFATTIGYTGDFCEFNGVEQNKETEFAMLLEPSDTASFALISNVVAAIAIAPTTDLANPNCPISRYTKQLLDYYQKNAAAIREKNKDISELLDDIQKTLEISCLN